VWGGPIRYFAGKAYESVKGQITDRIANAFTAAEYSSGQASDGANGITIAGSVVLGGLGALKVIGGRAADGAADLVRYEKYWNDLATKPGTLSDRTARAFYLSEEARIPSLLDRSLPLEGQARQAFEMRNGLRTQARDLMADRQMADFLNRTEPNMTWNQVVDKYSGKYSGDELWYKIIGSSQKSRASVNQQLGF